MAAPYPEAAAAAERADPMNAAPFHEDVQHSVDVAVPQPRQDVQLDDVGDVERAAVRRR